MNQMIKRVRSLTWKRYNKVLIFLIFPHIACLFISNFDTLDRDPLSDNFQKYLPDMKPLNDGRNHIMFNLYSGSWPDYQELDFASDDYPNYGKFWPK